MLNVFRIGLLVVLSATALTSCGYVGVDRETPVVRAGQLLKNGNTAEGMQMLTQLAEAGDPKAQEYLGWIYAQGSVVPIDDTQAQMWFRLAASHQRVPGHHEFNVSRQFRLGNAPLGKDLTRAALWLQRAADAGHPDARRLLADTAKLSALDLTVEPTVTARWSGYVRTQ